MNKVALIGRLTKDPEVRYSNSDTPIAVARYTLAVKRRSKTSDGDTDFINVVAFRRNGEYAEKNFGKGQLVSIVGHIHQSIWEDAEHIRHSSLEVIAEEQQGILSRSSQSHAEAAESVEHEAAASAMEEDDLPY